MEFIKKGEHLKEGGLKKLLVIKRQMH